MNAARPHKGSPRRCPGNLIRLPRGLSRRSQDSHETLVRPPNSQEYTNTFVLLADVAGGSEEKRECGKCTW